MAHVVWRERERMGALEYEFTVAVRPTRLVSTMTTPDAGFTGRWIYQILPDANGTVLTITEEGAVENPLFRFLSRFVLREVREHGDAPALARQALRRDRRSRCA